MRANHIFSIVLLAICFIAIGSAISFGQVPGRLFGVPICTGFYVDVDTSAVHKRINKLEQSADSLRREAARLSDSLLRERIPTFGNYGEEFQKYWKRDTPFENYQLPFDGLYNLKPNPILPHLDNNPPFIEPDNNPQQWNIDPRDGDFFDQRIPHSPFYYNPPNNIERMPSPKIEPFKDEKKNPIKDFKGWYYERVADIAK